MIVFLTTILILLCLAVVLLILIQRTSGGMGSALGGGAADQYLGAGSAAQLSKLTVWGIFFFFLLSFGLYALYQSDASSGDQLLRSGNVAPEVIPGEVALPESSPAELPSQNLSVQESSANLPVITDDMPANPVVPQPIASGNSSQ